MSKSLIDKESQLALVVAHLLSQLSQADFLAVITMPIAAAGDVTLVASVRNAATERMNDLIADRYADHLLGESAA